MTPTVHLTPDEVEIATALDMEIGEYAEHKLLLSYAKPLEAPIADILRPNRKRLSGRDKQIAFALARAFRDAGWRPPQ
jgi:hypothetical protein